MYEIDGHQFVVDKEFLEKAKPITIGFEGQGFKLGSAIEIAEGCGGCGADGDAESCN
ncbi:MAG: hypothetical protein V3S89_15950 [Desulfobacterales bacterium]